ncbi:hypothetical protein BD289DRAFT_128834 [Coniella lustricola]|uniref:Secreted protein n=1 Tax=Coniella lustricola TaxID=2025994 RepID=A0A2T2ZW44_9PEZI|nr:hypothetical protein BD289DRAFT_128834 [Coniella lustricola]
MIRGATAASWILLLFKDSGCLAITRATVARYIQCSCQTADGRFLARSSMVLYGVVLTSGFFFSLSYVDMDRSLITQGLIYETPRWCVVGCCTLVHSRIKSRYGWPFEFALETHYWAHQHRCGSPLTCVKNKNTKNAQNQGRENNPSFPTNKIVRSSQSSSFHTNLHCW